LKTFTSHYRGTVPEGPRPLLCCLGAHDWTDWTAHELPCGGGVNVLEHTVRRCTRCNQHDHKVTYTEE
jgi:hypothetical protein